MEEKDTSQSTKETTTAETNPEKNTNASEDEELIQTLLKCQTETDNTKLYENIEKFNKDLAQLKEINTLLTEANLNVLKSLSEKNQIKIYILLCHIYLKILSNENLYSVYVSSITDQDISKIPFLINLVEECANVLDKVSGFIYFEDAFWLKNKTLDLLQFIYVNHRKKLENNKEISDKLLQLITDLPTKFFDPNYLELNKSKELFNIVSNKLVENVENLENKFFSINDYFQQKNIFERFCQFNSGHKNFSSVGSENTEAEKSNAEIDENFYLKYGIFLLKLCKYHNYIFLSKSFKKKEEENDPNKDDEYDGNVRVLFLLDKIKEYQNLKENKKDAEEKKETEEKTEEKKETEEKTEEKKEEKKETEEKTEEKKEESGENKEAENKETEKIEKLMENKRFISVLKDQKYYDLLTKEIKNYLELSKNFESNKEIKSIRNDLSDYIDSVIAKNQYIPINLKEFTNLTIRDGFSQAFETNVTAGKSNKFYIETKENQNTLVYLEFYLEDKTKDITLEVNKFENSLNNFKNIYKDEKVDGIYKFFIYCNGYSLYQIVFNNEYSWFNSKDVSYKVCLLDGLEAPGTVVYDKENNENEKICHYFDGKKLDLKFDEIEKKVSENEKKDVVNVPVLLYLKKLRIFNNDVFEEFENENNVDKEFFEKTLGEYLKKNNLATDKKINVLIFNLNRDLKDDDNNYVGKIGFDPNGEIGEYKINYQLYDFCEQCLIYYLYLCKKEKKETEKPVLFIEFDKLVANGVLFKEGELLTKLNEEEKNLLNNINHSEASNVVELVEKINEKLGGVDLVLSAVDNSDSEHKKKLEDLFEEIKSKCKDKVNVTSYQESEIAFNVLKDIYLFY